MFHSTVYCFISAFTVSFPLSSVLFQFLVFHSTVYCFISAFAVSFPLSSVSFQFLVFCSTVYSFIFAFTVSFRRSGFHFSFSSLSATSCGPILGQKLCQSFWTATLLVNLLPIGTLFFSFAEFVALTKQFKGISVPSTFAMLVVPEILERYGFTLSPVRFAENCCKFLGKQMLSHDSWCVRAKGKFAKASRTTLLLFCIDAITVFLALRDTQRAKVAASKTPSGTVSVSSFLLTRSVCVCQFEAACKQCDTQRITQARRT